MKLHFHNKLFIYIAIIIVGLTVIFMTIFSSYIYKNLLKESKINLNQITSRTTSDLETLFMDMDKLSLYISTNPEVMNAFSQANSNEYTNTDLSKKIISILTSITIPNNSSRFRVNLYNRKGNFISTGIPYHKKLVTSLLNSVDYKSWYDALPIVHNNENITPFQKDNWSNTEVRYLSLYREIFDAPTISQVVGIIEIQCPYHVVNKILSFDSAENNSYLFDQSGNLIFTAGRRSFDAADLYHSFTKQEYREYASGNYGNLLYAGVYLDNGWSLVVTQTQEHIRIVLFTFMAFVLIIGASAIVICLFITFLVTKHSTKPLRELSEYVKNVSINNLSLDMNYKEYPDELISLNTAFQKMFERLKISMDENVKMKTYEMRANMIALQSQIDPHFLYNILTVIKAMSRENKTREIGITCNYLVNMLRYTSDYTEELVTLEKELNHADCYLNLMKMRYEEQFVYQFEIASEIDVSRIMIPKLSLQPILENCFQHGFKKVLPPWSIHIRCWMDKEKLYIQITDNGIGISEEAVHQLKNKSEQFLLDPSNSIISLKIGGLGLINTIARIKLRYKNHVAIDICPLPNGGTQVTIGGNFSNEYFIS